MFVGLCVCLCVGVYVCYQDLRNSIIEDTTNFFVVITQLTIDKNILNGAEKWIPIWFPKSVSYVSHLSGFITATLNLLCWFEKHNFD